MEEFINSMTKLTISKKVLGNNLFLYNYFDMYSKNIEFLSEKEKNNVYSIVYNGRKELVSSMFKFLNYYFSIDTSIRGFESERSESERSESERSESNMKNYVVYSLYCMLYEANIDEIYYNEIDKMELYISGKSRVDTYYGYIKKDFDTVCECNIFIKFNFQKSEEFLNRVIKLKDLCMPYIFLNFKALYQDFVVIESPRKLVIEEDSVFNVLGDIVNQLRSINKFYYFQYLEPRAIGKSNKKMNQKYFIFDFVGLEDKDSPVIQHNVFDGRETYNTIHAVDQVRMVINILADIYIQTPISYRKKMKTYPFDKFMEYLEVFTSGEENPGETDCYLNYMRKIMSL